MFMEIFQMQNKQKITFPHENVHLYSIKAENMFNNSFIYYNNFSNSL
jgi:hypothetical protein